MPSAPKIRRIRPKSKAPPTPQYDLRLYISGASERSRQALANIRAIGQRYLRGKYRLTVVDVYQQPDQARTHEIFATPTLVKQLPLPLREMVGDLSDEERVLIGLDLVPKPAAKDDAA